MSFSAKELKVIADSQFFDAEWYVANYPDVSMTGIPPAQHYLRFGGRLGRDPSSQFSTSAYLRMHQDVAHTQMNALLHFERYGKKEGRQYQGSQLVRISDHAPLQSRLGQPTSFSASEEEARATIQRILSSRLESEPKKLFSEFDGGLEDEFLSAALAIYQNNRKHYEAIKVSVVMPTYNRGDRIAKAVRSVQEQSHSNFELIIIDDGSDDNTREVLDGFVEDPRIRALWNDHEGVSVARNIGLRNATGSIIFYLDSDNIWTPDFLATMVVAFEISETDCIYGASKLQNAHMEVLGYRGEPFSWDQCLSGNYVDMNVFGHRAELMKKHGVFDETLERMVDWDLILRYTRAGGASYCPVIGCIYFEDGDDANRITTSKPYIFRKIVQEKNKLGLATTAETFSKISLKIAIKIPAPFEVRMAWGDFHYAESLKAALERLGHEVRLDFLGDWDRPVNSSDVTLVLRGLSAYEPKPAEFSVLWNISHPDQVSYEEYSFYKVICIASTSYAALLSHVLERPVHALLQCTDSDRFGFRPIEDVSHKSGIFVGNSRNEYREIVRWSVESGLELDIYGQRWEQFVPSGMIKNDNVPNHKLADLYAGGRFVLNDHWASMRDFGIISNRIFDVVGCGGRLVSDRIASIEELFGEVVETVSNQEELKATLAAPLPPVSQEQRRAASELVHAKHSFDTRAAQIIDYIGSTLIRSKGSDSQPAETHLHSPTAVTGICRRRKRVGLYLQRGRAWPTSSGFIRLIAPLTTDYASTKLDIIILEDPDDSRLNECDICIVQRIAVCEEIDADRLLLRLKQLSIPLYVDTDDAFYLHEQHKNDDLVLQKFMKAACETWFSTPALQDLYAHIPGTKRVLRNNLDPRFWRNYRKPVNTKFDARKVRFVYMGTATHDQDFFEIMPAFERLGREKPDAFELTLVGAVRNPPVHSWLNRLTPPLEKGGYPHFVRWLVENGKFDVGIAPLADNPFNRAKSDIKILDYGALGLLPMVSDCEAYKDAIAARLVIGCKHDTGDWYNQAASILQDRASFEPLRSRILDHVWQSRNVLTQSTELVDLLTA